jgi:anti-sigma factor RsiW
MECKQAQEVLADYLGDELDRSGRVAFESHLAICPQCRREAESLQSTLRRLEQLPGPLAMMPDGSGTSLPTWKRRTSLRRRSVARILTYAATLAIGVGIGWFGRSKPSSAGQAFRGGLPETGRDIVSTVGKGQVADPFLRNAVALSAALSQPLRDQ